MQNTFGDKWEHFEAGEVRPLTRLVKVDVPIFGCPINPEEFVHVMTHVLMGRRYVIPTERRVLRVQEEPIRVRLRPRADLPGPGDAVRVQRDLHQQGPSLLRLPRVDGSGERERGEDVLEEHGYTVEQIVSMFNIYWQRSPSVQRLPETAGTKGREPWRLKSTT